MISKMLLISLCFSMLAFLASETRACSCAFVKPTDAIKDSDAVFIGQVTAELIPRRKWTVTVSNVIKGDVKKTITLYPAMVGTSCESSNFELNKTYVFFAEKLLEADLRDEDTGLIDDGDREKIGNYEPRVCSWTTLLSDWNTEWYRSQLKEFKDEGFLKLLKKGAKPKS